MSADPLIVAALLPLMTEIASSVFIKHLREKFSPAVRNQLPTEIKSEADAKQVMQVLRETTPQFPPEEVKKDTFDLLRSTYEELESFHKELKRQASTAFNLTSILMTIGTIVIFIGVVLMFFENVPAGAVTSGAGLVSDIIAGLTFLLYRHTNQRLDKTRTDLFAFVRAQYATTVEDEAIRVDLLRKSG